MQSGTVDDVVVAWLRRVSAAETPAPSVVAFNIGLFETEGGFSAYLAGAERYDPNDSDWACDETFTPGERYVALPVSRGETKWQQAVDSVADGARRFLASSDGACSFLARAQAVTRRRPRPGQVVTPMSRSNARGTRTPQRVGAPRRRQANRPTAHFRSSHQLAGA